MAQKIGGDMLRGGSELGEASSSEVGAIVKEIGDETSCQVLGMFERDCRSLICYIPSTKNFHQIQKFDEKMMHSWFTTVVIDDHIYAFNRDKSVYRLKYTDMNATWHRMADMNEYHGFEPPAAVLDGFIYVIGIDFLNIKTGSSETFDPMTNTWSRIKDMNIARRGNSVVACKGFIYSIGGCDESLDRLTSVERFDPRTGEWSQVASMNEPVVDPTAVELNNKIYVIGNSSVECYDPEQDAWTTTVMTHEYSNIYSASAVNGNIYAGDWKSHELLMLNLTEKKWESVANLSRYNDHQHRKLMSLSFISRDKYASHENDDEVMLGGFYGGEDEVQLSARPSKLQSESSLNWLGGNVKDRGMSSVHPIKLDKGDASSKGTSSSSSGYYSSGSVISSSESKLGIGNEEEISLSLTKEENLKETVSQPPYVISHEQIIKPAGGTIVLPNCALRFKRGSFKNDCTVKETLKFDKSQCPDKYFAICPFLDVKFSEPLLKPVSVEMQTICSSNISECSDILVDVLHQKDGSREWDHVATLPLSHRRVVEFECNDFSPLFVGIKYSLAKWGLLTFTLKGYLYAKKNGNFSVVFFVNHSVSDAQMVQKYKEQPGWSQELTYGPFTINIGDGVKVQLNFAGIQAENFHFAGKHDFSIVFSREFICNISKSCGGISIEPVDINKVPSWVAFRSKLFLNDNLVENGEQSFNFRPDFSSQQGGNALIQLSGNSCVDQINMSDMTALIGSNQTPEESSNGWWCNVL